MRLLGRMILSADVIENAKIQNRDRYWRKCTFPYCLHARSVFPPLLCGEVRHCYDMTWEKLDSLQKSKLPMASVRRLEWKKCSRSQLAQCRRNTFGGPWQITLPNSSPMRMLSSNLFTVDPQTPQSLYQACSKRRTFPKILYQVLYITHMLP